MLDKLLETFLRIGDIVTAREVMDFCRDQKMYSLGLVLGKYFMSIFNDISILSNMASCAYNCKDYKLSYDLYDKILLSFNLDELTSSKILNNQVHCIQYISDDYTYYNPEIVREIIKPHSRISPLITFTITTCKRYDLFEKTMNSFINCCTDLDRIDKWLCIDDNSSEEDRKKMQKNYPFFQFYFKTKAEKGHPQSMNILRKKVTTPYMFHMEDDWKFFAKRPYISECFEVLCQNPQIGQCLINKNYSEIETIKIVGGIFNLTNSGKRYYIHEHCSTAEQYDVFNKKYGQTNNCAYWPHFSFRPSLLLTDILTKLGEFDELIAHFEMDYSYRYKNNNYVSAFLEGIYCVHIGRLTSDRHDNTKANAYILNDEKQFVNKDTPSIGLNIKTYVINLDRRPDRWETFQKQKEVKCLNYERFSAVDGSKLEPNEQLQRIFDGNDYNMREGMVGCAMSHIKLYIDLINSSYDAYCILEDDLDFVPNFKEKFLHLYNNLPTGWDMCYLGHHLWEQYKTAEHFDKNVMPISEKWDTYTSLKYSMGGTGGYIISKKGALAMLEIINKIGMTNGIDTVQQIMADVLNIYYCKPHLIYSECCTVEKKCDTDIQYNYTSLTIPLEKRIINEEMFYSQFGSVRKTDVEAEISSTKDVLIYTGNNIEEVLEKCIHPCYPLGNKFAVIVPEPNEIILNKRYFDRLKKNKQFNIVGALKYKSRPKIISFGDNTHVYEAIKSLDSSVLDYPFDTMEDGNLEVFTLLSEIILKMNDEDIQKFVIELVNSGTSTFVQEYNKKTVLKNDRYKICFPHEDIEHLVSIYTKRFKNFRDIITGNDSVVLVYCTRWKSHPVDNFYYCMDMFRKYNSNIGMVVINALNKDIIINEKYKSCLQREYIDFPVELRVDEWPVQKVIYDQNVFRLSLSKPIRKYI
jgi:GR25 family glycosyltransferase involved in LPS biosynthesis